MDEFNILSIEHDITKSLSHEKYIEKYATTKCRENLLYRCVRPFINNHFILFFWIFRCL